MLGLSVPRAWTGRVTIQELPRLCGLRVLCGKGTKRVRKSQIPAATFNLLSWLSPLSEEEGLERLPGRENVADGDVQAGRHFEINFSTQPKGIFGSSLY